MLVGCGTSPILGCLLGWRQCRVAPGQVSLWGSIVGMKEQAPWSLEKEELAEEVGGRASGKVGSGYGWGLALFLAMPQALISLSLLI